MKLYKFDTERLEYVVYPYRRWIVGVVIGLAAFVFLGFLGGFHFPKMPNIVREKVYFEAVTGELSLTDLDIEQIRLIESSNCDSAVSGEGAIGNMQIMPVTLHEWNRFHPEEQYTEDDLFKRKVNLKIGKWMLAKQIPMYLAKDTIPNKLCNKLIIYNWGIGNFLKWYRKGENYSALPEETRNYLLKYWKKY